MLDYPTLHLETSYSKGTCETILQVKVKNMSLHLDTS